MNSSLHNTHKGWVFTCRLEGNLSLRCLSISSGKGRKQRTSQTLVDCLADQERLSQGYNRFGPKQATTTCPMMKVLPYSRSDANILFTNEWCAYFTRLKDMLKSYRLRCGVASSYEDSNVETVFSQISVKNNNIEQPNN